MAGQSKERLGYVDALRGVAIVLMVLVHGARAFIDPSYDGGCEPADASAMENLAMGAFLRRDKDGAAQDMERVFELFPVLKERRNQLGGTLSGGEQQMLAIGRALMSRPELLLLDEPSLGLAPKLVETIFETIQEINKAGTTIFLVEQNAQMALTVSNEGYVMETGSIVLADKAAALLANDQVRKAYLGEE